MANINVIYLVVLFFSVQAKVLKDNEITDNHIHIDFKPTQEAKDVHHAKLSEKELINNLLDDFLKSEHREIPLENSTEGTKIDNGTALILTPYIEQQKIEEAQRLSEVNADLFLGIRSYSGFLTVNETYNSNLFFWYFPGERDENTPWIVWLQGGPGQSSMMGLFQEIGPFLVEDTNGTLRLNRNSWLQNHSLVFIDSPVGTGFSFTEHEDGYAQTMGTYGAHLYSAVHQLVQLFPELQTAPLFVAGESYAGKYVPALATQIHNRKDELPEINLQGVMVGNGYIDPYLIKDLTRSFYSFGMLGPEQVEMTRPLVQALQRDIEAGDSIQAKNKFNSLIAIVLAFTRQNHAYNFLRERLPVGKCTYLLDKSEIKRAIHVGDMEFDLVNMTVNSRLTEDFLSSANPLYETLLEHYDVLAYCGQLDQLISCVAESENYRRWQWSGSNEFRESTRSALVHRNRLAGYHKTGGRFTEALIVGAGHMVPMDMPEPLRHLVAEWTHHRKINDFPSVMPIRIQHHPTANISYGNKD